MVNLDENQIAKEIEHQLTIRNIEFKEIGIFGLRAMGKARVGSDWDCYALVNNPQNCPDSLTIANDVVEALELKCINFRFVRKRPYTAKPLLLKKQGVVKVMHYMYLEYDYGNLIIKQGV